MIEQIYSAPSFGGSEHLATVVRRHEITDGVKFFTDPKSDIQVGTVSHEAGYVTQPHQHVYRDRRSRSCIEVLYVLSGEVTVDFYTSSGEPVGWRTLSPGDFVILLDGYHGLRYSQDTYIFEVKQGPHLGQNDKVFLSPSPEGN